MTEASPIASTRRYHGLDALRAGAMALGVVLHAAAPYLRYPMDGLVWAVDGPVAGTAGFPWADAIFWWLHAWRVPLFFVLAGFFAAMLVERRGVRAFLKHRTERVLWPLGLACVLILPATYFAFAWGWSTTGLATWSDVLRISFGKGLVKDDVLGPAHLWFLVYLYLFCVIHAGMARLWPRGWRMPAGRRRWHGACGLVVIVGVTATIVRGHDAVALTFENDFVPRPLEFVYQLWFFVVGVAMYHGRGMLDGLGRHAGAWACVLAVAAISLVPTTTTHLARTQGPLADGGLPWVFAAVWAGSAWLSILALLAAAVRWLGTPRAWVRWLSDSAYWVYLTHVPLVALVHVALHGTAVPIGVRFGIAVLGPLAATLLSYRYLVRYTMVGVWLHGRRERPPRPPA